jgi:hypothetical protein
VPGRGTIQDVLEPEPINARFVGGPLDGETHRLAHRLPYVQVPGPDETFFARLWIERPECEEHLLYAVDGADDAETLVYRTMADRPEGDPGPVAGTVDPGTIGAPAGLSPEDFGVDPADVPQAGGGAPGAADIGTDPGDPRGAA